MQRSEQSALLAAGLTALLWGLAGIFVRLLPPVSPFTVTAGRLLVALVVAVPVFWVLRDGWPRLRGALGRRAAYVFALLLASYYLLATAAFQLAPVVEVALLISTPPLFVLGYRRVHGDAPTRAETAGALLALAGIALIMLPKLTAGEHGAADRLLGNLLAISAAALTAAYAYLYSLSARRGNPPDTIGVSLLTFVAGTGVLVLLVGVTPQPSGLDALDGHALWMFLGLGVLSTAIPTLAFAVASKRLPPLATSTILLFIPVFAGLFAYLILGERLSPTVIPGGALVLGGVGLVLRGGKR